MHALHTEFPITGSQLYLDSAFQTPLPARVRAQLAAFYDAAHATAGPKSLWLARMADVRDLVARLFAITPSEIAFTKNTSEGLNIASHAVPWKAGDNVLLAAGEHPNNVCAWLNLRSKGLDVRLVPSTGKWIDACTFEPYVDRRTRAISVSHVSFHSGQRNDLESISALCRDRGAMLIVDATQSAGVLPLDVASLQIAMLAAGCHKGLLATHGLGVFACDRRFHDLQPTYAAYASLADPPADLVLGPKDVNFHADARRFEIGNPNFSGIYTLGASLELVLGVGVETIADHVLGLGDRLIARLDELGIELVGPRERARRSHIYVLDLPGDGWLAFLAQQGVRVSQVRSGIRVSFALFNVPEDVDRLAEILRRGLHCVTPKRVLGRVN
ncbi:MAG: aminotransferase class V-fold PLP-dependent enzyme [Vulcanimicrobiaceae bacterium]